MASELRSRVKDRLSEADLGAGFSNKSPDEHPAGPVKHSLFTQYSLMATFTVFFIVSCISIHMTQIVAILFLYPVSKDAFYTVITFTKQNFGLFMNTINEWFAPTRIRISGDKSVKGQLEITSDGLLKTTFPERLVLMANHQIYTEWGYLWWISYTSRLHGHIFIILKESLKYVPVLGPGMLLFKFIFLARNWAKDKVRFEYGVKRLNVKHRGPMSGSGDLDPMWLLIFPEGTNLSKNARRSSQKWSEKIGIPDFKHVLIPRSTGLQFCLQNLKGTLDWIYDCTIAYEGVPHGEYGQDIFTLRSTYFQGRIPPSVSMHWRRFHVSTIPLDDSRAFELWLRERWAEKDNLIEYYQQNGQFPPDESGIVEMRKAQSTTAKSSYDNTYVETRVASQSRAESLEAFVPIIILLTVVLTLGGIFKPAVTLDP